MYSNVGELARYMGHGAPLGIIDQCVAEQALLTASVSVDVFLAERGEQSPASPSDAIAWRKASELATRQAAALLDPDGFAGAAELYAAAWDEAQAVELAEILEECADVVGDMIDALDDEDEAS